MAQGRGDLLPSEEFRYRETQRTSRKALDTVSCQRGSVQKVFIGFLSDARHQQWLRKVKQKMWPSPQNSSAPYSLVYLFPLSPRPNSFSLKWRGSHGKVALILGGLSTLHCPRRGSAPFSHSPRAKQRENLNLGDYSNNKITLIETLLCAGRSASFFICIFSLECHNKLRKRGQSCPLFAGLREGDGDRITQLLSSGVGFTPCS